jgi:hypothetical protein
MTGKNLLFALPLLLLAGLSACASNGVQPGVVNRSGSQQGYGQNTGYGAPNQSYVPNQGQGQGQNQGYQNASMSNGPGNGPVSGTTPLDPNDPNYSNSGPGPQTAAAAPMASGNGGRVVSINDVSLQGGGGRSSGGGIGNGTLIGGLLGGAGGAAIGASGGRGLGGGLVGGLLGVVGGAIAGTIFDQHCGTGGGGGGGGGRGIEVTVQKDDGQKVTVAQRDDGDIQLGDRVQIVQGRNGVAQVVRDTQRNPD